MTSTVTRNGRTSARRVEEEGPSRLTWTTKKMGKMEMMMMTVSVLGFYAVPHFFFIVPLSLSPTRAAPPPVVKKKKLGKNPTVDTSFLPDRDREVRSKHRSIYYQKA